MLKINKWIKSVNIDPWFLSASISLTPVPLQVRNYLESLQPAASHIPAMDLSSTNITSITADLTTNNTNTSRKDSVEFTDIQLLAYLTQFEEKNRQEKETSLVLSRKGKVRIDGLKQRLSNEWFMTWQINWPSISIIVYSMKSKESIAHI